MPAWPGVGALEEEKAVSWGRLLLSPGLGVLERTGPALDAARRECCRLRAVASESSERNLLRELARDMLPVADVECCGKSGEMWKMPRRFNKELQAKIRCADRRCLCQS